MPPRGLLFGLRAIIIGVQPLLVLAYLALAYWGEAITRPQGAWLWVLLLPLILVSPPLWRGHYAAFVWAALFDLFYLMLALTDAFSGSADRAWQWIIIVLSASGFISAWMQGILLRRAARREKLPS
ncbi:DUF2069 domain-containing protein [Halothiobacillus sp. DCM-1]|uniref:DUF2069 domain-containing protein n=1 Tax=Halothiobacillus sp. DCM-1 TaxID=3112558 RepID=UPI00325011A9